jgi:hypothetical protein
MPEIVLEQDLETTGCIRQLCVVYRNARDCTGAGSGNYWLYSSVVFCVQICQRLYWNRISKPLAIFFSCVLCTDMPEIVLVQDLETTGCILQLFVLFRYARDCAGEVSGN